MRDRWLSGGLTDQEIDELIECVRVRLLRYVENHRLAYGDVAKKTGYAEATIGHFARKERVSLAIAQRVVATYPELGNGLICRECGALIYNPQEGDLKW